jgi:DNA polymerase-3 subunit epsilon
VNTGATGLALGRDRLLAVAAIAVDAGLIAPGDSIYVDVEPDPARALAELLAFVGKGPVVAFNAGFNRAILERAFEAHLGMVPALPWLDLFLLLPALFTQYFDGPARLGDWMRAFGIETFQRHHALGDAWAIAQLFLAAQARALVQGASTPRGLAEIEYARRQLQRPA